MKKIWIRNLIIVLSLIVLSVPYNYFFKYYTSKYLIIQYVPIIVFALLCGASLMLMDLSNRRINTVFAIFYLVFIVVVNFGVFPLYGPAMYFYIVMFGALLTSIFTRK